ncbi:MAG: D-2-hydroxyacid dehydrogenase family protein [Betaproteobacteria bacterium]|nr:MAG: D-2-hydroxyacid dehydrogenase family protein [Betaproteobacteria bacterium]
MTKVAVLDDWQGVARQSADWSELEKRAQVQVFDKPFNGAADLVRQVADFEIIIAMRERSPFPKSVIDQLTNLRMIAVTGPRTWTMDIAACTARHIPVCHTGGALASAATAEIALGLLLAAARHIAPADASMRDGRFQQRLPVGTALEGKTLGVIGLGKIGSRMARYGLALGMRVLAWSRNLTEETASGAGVQRVGKDTLLRESDAISLHLVLSDQSRGTIGPDELKMMKDSAIVINTSRGPLIDEKPLLENLRAGRLIAALDVFDREPLPVNHPLRSLPNTVLTPHQGYCTQEIYSQFYSESIENVLAYLDGNPIRMLNPDALAT